MIATLALVLGSFAFAIRRSYRRARASGQPFQPKGKRRWTEDSVP